jgi:hypothetical protein
LRPSGCGWTFYLPGVRLEIVRDGRYGDVRPVGTGRGNAQSKQKGVRQVRRALVWFLILGLIMSLLFIAGCGKDETSEEKPSGESEVTQENEEAKVNTEKGEEETASDNAEGESVPDGSGNEAPADDGGNVAPPDVPEGEDIIPDISRDIPTEEQLGAPIYPGAAYVPDSGGSATSTGPEGEISVTYAEFTTNDSFDKVVAFYEGRLGPPQQKAASIQQAVWMVNNSDGTITMVAVNPANGGLMIAMGRTTGDLNQY